MRTVGPAKRGQATQDAIKRAQTSSGLSQSLGSYSLGLDAAPPLPFSEAGAPKPPEDEEPPSLLPLSTETQATVTKSSTIRSNASPKKSVAVPTSDSPPASPRMKVRQSKSDNPRYTQQKASVYQALGARVSTMSAVAKPMTRRKSNYVDGDSDSEEGNYEERPTNFRQRTTMIFKKAIKASKKIESVRRRSVEGIRHSVSRFSRSSVYRDPNEAARSSLNSSGASDQDPNDGDDDENEVFIADEDIPCTMTPEEIKSAASMMEAAIKWNDLDIVNRILRRTRVRGAVLQVLARVNEDGETPAHTAAIAGKASIVQALLLYRADPCKRDQNLDFGGEGLWPSETKGIDMTKEAMTNVLHNEGKSVVYYMRLTGIFEEVFQGLFPASKVKLVKAIAADIEKRRNDPALVCAAKDGQEDLFKLFLDHVNMLPQHGIHNIRGGVGVIRCQSVRGAALFVASYLKKPRMVELLLASKLPVMDLESRDSIGRTALYAAASSGDAHVVQLLVSASANIQTYSDAGLSPVHEAAREGHSAVVKVLVDAGADLNSCSLDTTKLGEGSQSAAASSMVAARSGMLVSTSGKNALDIAQEAGHIECARLIQTALQPGDKKKTKGGTEWHKTGAEEIVKFWPGQPSKPQKGPRLGLHNNPSLWRSGETYRGCGADGVRLPYDSSINKLHIPAYRFHNPAHHLPRYQTSVNP